MRASMLWCFVLSGTGALLAGCGDDGASGAQGAQGGASSSAASSGSGGNGGGGADCSDARELALGRVETVSTGEIKELATEGVAKTLYIDASAGGIMNQAMNPWIYVRLSSGTKAEVTDETADTSKEWDIALKRPLIRTNSGDGGPGDGGAALLDGKLFDDVSMADASSATILVEDWFDEECHLQTDATGAVKTTFDGWYDYAMMSVTPHPGVFVVRGGDGALYKLAFLDYYSTPEGGSGMAGGHYKLKVAPLQ